MAVTLGRSGPILLIVVSATALGWFATGWLDGPWGMLPGGRLRGVSHSCEGVSWADYASVREVEVETRPDRPRSITTWSIVQGGELFVPADFLTPWKRWPHDALKDDRIRIRVAGNVFECAAERVVDDRLIAQLRQAIAAKYDLQPDGRAATIEVWWFRVLPR